jgi:hypothetical protein
MQKALNRAFCIDSQYVRIKNPPKNKITLKNFPRNRRFWRRLDYEN